MKKSIFARILSLLICAVVLLSCVACAGESGGEAIPSGMQNATATGDDFRLYVPTHWSANTAYGVSGGYYHLTEQSTISMVKYPITEDMKTQLPAPTEEDLKLEARAEWFYQNELLTQIDAMKDGELTAADQNGYTFLMDSVNAVQYHVTGKINEKDMHFLHVIGERNNAFYVLSYTVTDALYLMLVEDYVNILNSIRFAEPYVPEENAKDVDENAEAPEGMKLASNDDVQYRLYVPVSWKIDHSQEIFGAYAEEDFSNVSVIPYLPTGEQIMNVMEYFEANKRLMISTPNGGFDWVDDTKQEGVEVKLGGSPAMRYDYYFSVGGVQFRYMQIIAAYEGMFYNFTYTARADRFEAHVAEVDAIVEAFRFR